MSRYAVSLLLLAGGFPALGQDEMRRPRLFLPEVPGAAVVGIRVDAMAARVLAAGSFLQSEALARKIHAEAASLEMDNARKWVETYFERRLMNREYRQKLNPDHLAQAQKRLYMQRRRVLEQPQDLEAGDMVWYMNWLLDSLAPAAFENSWNNLTVDVPLLEDDLDHLLVTEGVASQRSRFVFRISDGQVLASDWPLALQNPEFATERDELERRRDEALNLARAGERMSWDDVQTLRQSLDRLTEKFNEHFSQRKRDPEWQRSMDDFREYLEAERYLQGLASSIGRLAAMGDFSGIEVGRSLKGGTVLDLVNHMVRYGLEFANPEAGDEAMYRKLFLAMRAAYVELEPNPPFDPGQN